MIYTGEFEIFENIIKEIIPFNWDSSSFSGGIYE